MGRMRPWKGCWSGAQGNALESLAQEAVVTGQWADVVKSVRVSNGHLLHWKSLGEGPAASSELALSKP